MKEAIYFLSFCLFRSGKIIKFVTSHQSYNATVTWRSRPAYGPRTDQNGQGNPCGPVRHARTIFLKNFGPVRAPYSPWLKIQLAQLSDTGFIRHFARRRHVDVRERPVRGPRGASTWNVYRHRTVHAYGPTDRLGELGSWGSWGQRVMGPSRRRTVGQNATKVRQN